MPPASSRPMICSSWTVTEAKPMRRNVAANDADQDRLPALSFGQPGGRQPDDDCVVAGKHQVDHDDLEKCSQVF